MRFKKSIDPIALWLYTERYLMSGTRDYSPFAKINEMKDEWHPESKLTEFLIQSFWVKDNKSSNFIFSPNHSNRELRSFYQQKNGYFLFPIHPATIPLLDAELRSMVNNLLPGPSLRVSPTSSTRTVYVLDAPNHFLKLHFPGRISRFLRSIDCEDVIHQIWISRQLSKENLIHLADVGGGYLISNQTKSIGFIIREPFPKNFNNTIFFTIPGFSLYGIDINSKNDPPLIAQLPYYFKEKPKLFISNRIIIPIIKFWIKVVFSSGVIPEMHGQNVLFNFDNNFSSSSIFTRDSDLFVDNRIKQLLGKNVYKSIIETLNNNSRISTEMVLSLSYDCFLINHFLVKIAESANQWFNIPVSYFRDLVIRTFRSEGGRDLPFSKDIYYFTNSANEGEKYNLIKQPEMDTWR